MERGEHDTSGVANGDDGPGGNLRAVCLDWVHSKMKIFNYSAGFDWMWQSYRIGRKKGTLGDEGSPSKDPSNREGFRPPRMSQGASSTGSDRKEEWSTHADHQGN